MVSFIIAIIALIAGYFIYGTIVEKAFGADEKIQTPAIRLEDGVDFVQMPACKNLKIIRFLPYVPLNDKRNFQIYKIRYLL
jgi:carbon starvation protein CstA